MRYVNRPAVIEAVQFDPEDKFQRCGEQDDSPVFLTRNTGDGEAYQLWVIKSDGWCDIEPGDYVIAESDGIGYYPCKQDIFEDKYTLLREWGVEFV